MTYIEYDIYRIPEATDWASQRTSCVTSCMYSSWFVSENRKSHTGQETENHIQVKKQLVTSSKYGIIERDTTVISIILYTFSHYFSTTNSFSYLRSKPWEDPGDPLSYLWQPGSYLLEFGSYLLELGSYLGDREERVVGSLPEEEWVRATSCEELVDILSPAEPELVLSVSLLCRFGWNVVYLDWQKLYRFGRFILHILQLATAKT